MHKLKIYGASILLILIPVMIISQAVWSENGDPIEHVSYLGQYTGEDADKTGSESCLICHDDRFGKKEHSHINLIDKDVNNKSFGYGCETCHGPGGNHDGDLAGILAPQKLTPKQSTESCSKCHRKLGSYNKNWWTASEHYYSELDCFSCHEGHSINRNFLIEKTTTETCLNCHLQQRKEFSRRSHHPVDEGLMDCSSCHNSMSGRFEYQLLDDGDELCFECHADKQGPFVFSMDIGTDVGGEGCLSCHVVHGSNTDSLLRYPRRLCLRCHYEMTPRAHFPGSCWSSDCHSEIHGSNTDALFLN